MNQTWCYSGGLDIDDVFVSKSDRIVVCWRDSGLKPFGNWSDEYENADDNYKSKTKHLFGFFEAGLYDKTEFKSPVDLIPTVHDEANNYWSFYRIYLTPVIIHKDTKLIVTEGKESHSLFYINVEDKK